MQRGYKEDNWGDVFVFLVVSFLYEINFQLKKARGPEA
jgi:hypothetical protein